jgi:hypothetical protein
MKDIEKIKNDINNIVVLRNKHLYDCIFCDVCYYKLKKYPIDKHIKSPEHDKQLDIFIRAHQFLECNDDITRRYLEIADYYINTFQYL